jgi:hypothetical protein
VSDPSPRHGSDDPSPRRCTATSSRTGERCRAHPVLGATVCVAHGGRAPQVRAAAARRLADAKLRKALDQVEVREVDDALAEFRRLMSEVVAFKDLAAAHVAALEDRIRSTDHVGAEQLRAEVSLYERALDRAGKLLGDWVRLGIEERMARVHEAQAAALGAALDKGLAAAGVTVDQRRRAIEVVREELRG